MKQCSIFTLSGLNNIKPDTLPLLLPSRQSGFTLVELIITMIVAAILVSVGLPSFTEFIRTNRTSNAAQQMQTAIMTARAASVSRGARVSIAAIEAGSPAVESWSNGWRVFVDTNNNGIADASEVVLLRQEAWATSAADSDYFFATNAVVPAGRLLGVPSYVNGRPLTMAGALGAYSFTVALTDKATGGTSQTVASVKHWRLNCVAVTGRARMLKFGDPGTTTSSTCPANG